MDTNALVQYARDYLAGLVAANTGRWTEPGNVIETVVTEMEREYSAWQNAGNGALSLYMLYCPFTNCIMRSLEAKEKVAEILGGIIDDNGDVYNYDGTTMGPDVIDEDRNNMLSAVLLAYMDLFDATYYTTYNEILCSSGQFSEEECQWLLQENVSTIENFHSKEKQVNFLNSQIRAALFVGASPRRIVQLEIQRNEAMRPTHVKALAMSRRMIN